MAEYNITDSWRGGIIIDFAEFTQEAYEEIFDTELISYSMAKSILEHGDETNEAIGLGLLNESYREQIADRILSGEYDGSVYGDETEFYFETKIELPAGLELDDIKDTGGLEHIVNFLKDIEKTSAWGELNEYFSFEYSDIDSISLNYTDLEDPVVGTITIDCREAHIQDHVIDFTYDRAEDTFTFEPDSDAWQYFDDIADEIEQFVRDDLKEHEKEQSLASQITSARDEKQEPSENKGISYQQELL